MNYLVKLSYDGNYYYGWAKQPNLITVQETLEKKLEKLFGEKILIHASGRTDRFVHAINQYFSFNASKSIPLQAIKDFLNGEREHFYIKSVIEVEENFHARFDAIQKTYQYKLLIDSKQDNEIFLKNYFLIYRKKIDLNLINWAIEQIIGKHDFMSFSAKETYESTIREIFNFNYSFIDTTFGTEMTFEITGSGFLRYMVRNIIGSIIALNENKITSEDFLDLIINPQKGKNHFKSKGSALYLYDVKYPSNHFKEG